MSYLSLNAWPGIQILNWLVTLESLIAVGLHLLIFWKFSTPYAVIRDPTLIKIHELKPHPMLIRNRYK